MKKILLAVLCVALVVGVAGCGSGNSDLVGTWKITDEYAQMLNDLAATIDMDEVLGSEGAETPKSTKPAEDMRMELKGDGTYVNFYEGEPIDEFVAEEYEQQYKYEDGEIYFGVNGTFGASFKVSKDGKYIMFDDETPMYEKQ